MTNSSSFTAKLVWSNTDGGQQFVVRYESLIDDSVSFEYFEEATHAMMRVMQLNTEGDAVELYAFDRENPSKPLMEITVNDEAEANDLNLSAEGVTLSW